MTNGLSNAEIGMELYISADDRQDARHAHPPEAELRDRVQAVVLAYQAGLVEAEVHLSPLSRDEPKALHDHTKVRASRHSGGDPTKLRPPDCRSRRWEDGGEHVPVLDDFSVFVEREDVDDLAAQMV